MNDFLACLADFKETESWPFLELAVADYMRRGESYHSWSHISHMSGLLQECWRENRAGEDVPRWLALAVLYHDLVYVPGATDNEERSAELLKKQFGWPDRIPCAVQAILLTAHRAEDYQQWVARNPPLRQETEWFLDADMAILGETPDKYEAYRLALKREYREFRDEEFANGRIAFLKRTLSSSQIYHSAWFAERYETSARENLNREVTLIAGAGQC